MTEFLFGDFVVVDGNLIGVVVKSWERIPDGGSYEHEVYVRMFNEIRTYAESQIERYRVRHKYLDEEELMYQNG
jgi:hypothetical protein